MTVGTGRRAGADRRAGDASEGPVRLVPRATSERAVVFGSHAGLVGVLTEPLTDGGPTRRAVLLSNVGTNHHVGPYRVWVELARRLAADGWLVLRFDQAGLGDSAPRPDAAPDYDDGTRDLAEAMAWLAESAGVERFVLVGFCSGVDAAHALAAADPRVDGAVFIDGYTYPTAGWRARRHVVRYLQPARWAGYARRRLRRGLLGRLSRAQMDAVGGQIFDRRYPSLERFRADLAAMTARGARLLFVYTGTLDAAYNGRGQLFEALGPRAARHGAIEAERLPSADHVFSSTAERQALIARVARWLTTLAGPGDA